MPITKLRIARGLKANLPQPPNSFEPGRPYFCTDTHELFIGTGLSSPMESVTTPITAEATAIVLTLNAGENVDAYQAGISDLDLCRAHLLVEWRQDSENPCFQRDLIFFLKAALCSPWPPKGFVPLSESVLPPVRPRGHLV